MNHQPHGQSAHILDKLFICCSLSGHTIDRKSSGPCMQVPDFAALYTGAFFAALQIAWVHVIVIKH